MDNVEFEFSLTLQFNWEVGDPSTNMAHSFYKDFGLFKIENILAFYYVDLSTKAYEMRCDVQESPTRDICINNISNLHLLKSASQNHLRSRMKTPERVAMGSTARTRLSEAGRRCC